MTAKDFVSFDKIFEEAIEKAVGTRSIQSTWIEHSEALEFMVHSVNEFFPYIIQKPTGPTKASQVDLFQRLYIR